ncbi:beta strand repeat-containing protein [Arthrobacter crystallopoietes]|uniref:beta strand repeat-containing protein n=1 Tax=Crystallibacter crystallopoietes TaxID=37928 RepID=UPI000C76A1B8|nr:hypothetical protein [Arthrobacter crystallopoietes]AUI51899.1 hypothetical protein AC20117_14985 [Arthrobacter crystallopoietes]
MTAEVSTGTLSAPTAVTVSLIGASTIPVNWTASSGTPNPEGYYITRSSSNGMAVPACGTSSTVLVTGTSCTDTAVAAGTFTYTVTAVYKSWTAASVPSGAVTVVAANKLAFTTSPSGATAGAPISPAVAVSLQSVLGTTVEAAGVPITVSLSGLNLNGARLSGTLTALTNAQGVAVFNDLSIDKAGLGFTLTATSSGLLDATSSPFTVNAPLPASRLVITTPPVSGPASATASLGQVTLQLQDASGNSAPAPAGGTVVALSSNSTGTKVFSATASGTPTTSLTIPAGSSTASFYYGDTKAGTPTLTISASGLTSAIQTATVSAAAASRMVFTSAPVSGAASATANLGPATVQRQDTFGNPVTAGATTLALTSNSAGGKVFSATAGGSTTTSVTIPAGSSTASFYYGDTKAGTPTLTVSASGLTSATQTATINAAAASKVVFTSAPVSGAASATATLGPATVQRQDTFGNPVTAGATTLALSSNSTGSKVFSATAGGTSTTNVMIPAGSSTASFYYGDTKAGTPTLTVSANGLTSATQTATVTAAPAARLMFGQQPPSTVRGGQVIAPAVTVLIVDGFGNQTTGTVQVTMRKGASPGDLKGSLTITAVNGIATFSDLYIAGQATASHVLIASTPGFADVTSNPFNAN